MTLLSYRTPIPNDIPCHVAYRVPPRTRKERAQQLKDRKEQFLAGYAPEAREVLTMLIEKYAEHGPSQLELPAGLEVPPIRDLGNPQRDRTTVRRRRRAS